MGAVRQMTTDRFLASTVLASLLAILGSACSVPLNPALPPLRVGTSGDYPPFSFRAADGAVTGLDLDVARQFARDTGRRLELVPFRWPELSSGLADGTFDLAMSGVTIRPERALIGTFTRPITASGAVVLVRRGLAETPVDIDRQGIRLAVNRGGHLERTARRFFPRAHIETVDDNLTLPQNLQQGSVDAIVCDRFEAERWRAGIAPTPRLIGPFTVDHKAYLVREPALATELDGWLRLREADGTLAAMRREWLGERDAGERTAFESDVDALLALIDLRMSFMPSVAAAKLAAGQPVVDPEQEERVLATAREEADRAGLERRSAVALFSALIAAARAVQSEYAELPPDRRPFVEAADLGKTLRPAIAEVSRTILRRAGAVARDPVAAAALPTAGLARHLDPGLTFTADRDRIANAIRGLRPTEDQSAIPSDR
jgi:cyclohexadienyl dehydratase